MEREREKAPFNRNEAENRQRRISIFGSPPRPRAGFSAEFFISSRANPSHLPIPTAPCNSNRFYYAVTVAVLRIGQLENEGEREREKERKGTLLNNYLSPFVLRVSNNSKNFPRYIYTLSKRIL